MFVIYPFDIVAFHKTSVNPVHNAPRLSVMGPGVGGGGGRGLL